MFEFLDLYSSSEPLAMLFCLLGKKTRHICSLWVNTTSHLDTLSCHNCIELQVSAHGYLKVKEKKGKKIKGLSAGNTHCHYKTLVKLHRPFKCDFPSSSLHPLLPWVRLGSTGPTLAGTSSQTPAIYPQTNTRQLNRQHFHFRALRKSGKEEGER